MDLKKDINAILLKINFYILLVDIVSGLRK